ncbi:uncharacterized protein LOC120575333 [Perca fluviatilis]|uniref:uncharacterized protein LOC120575333 n=1 Tax=Perca fluviatilis TaxID=8168 RepID=UPI0019653245|nr:uncharacterized protein LOC120575333 [Perca fluviatilis]
MAFPRLSASMLLASLILLLYWTTSSARSHDPQSFVVSPSYRVKRDLDSKRGMVSGTREKVEKYLAVGKSFLTVVKEVIGKSDTNKSSAVIKSLADVASLAPGISGLVASFVNMVLIFIPQNDPVLEEVKKGFEEVNKKLDSISIHISNLAIDVEWFNYASVYSQDELRILNSWKKFNDLLQNSQSVQIKDKVRYCGEKWCLMKGRQFRCVMPFSYYAKATHAVYGEEFAVAPAPILQHDCEGSYPLTTYTRKISIYNSRRLPVCQSGTCSNNGRCNQLLDSNEWLCECQGGYYGERCEKRTPIGNATAVDIPVVPDINTIDTKMKMIEVKLEEILKSINGTATVTTCISQVVPDIVKIDTKLKMMEIKLENKLKEILKSIKCSGERCEDRTSIATAINLQVVPDIRTIDTKIKRMEIKLEDILYILECSNRGWLQW